MGDRDFRVGRGRFDADCILGRFHTAVPRHGGREVRAGCVVPRDWRLIVVDIEVAEPSFVARGRYLRFMFSRTASPDQDDPLSTTSVGWLEGQAPMDWTAAMH